MKHSKNTLWRLITKDINYSIHSFHIIAVIHILIEEILKEMKAGKEIDITNFGILKIKRIKPKKITTINERNIKFVSAINSLRFILPRHISKYLLKEKKWLEKQGK